MEFTIIKKWLKGRVFRKIRTQRNYGPRKELATARRKMTCCAGVGRCKGQNKDDVAARSSKGRTFGKRGCKGLECNNGIRD
jgi:hypothetical protein